MTPAQHGYKQCDICMVWRHPSKTTEVTGSRDEKGATNMVSVCTECGPTKMPSHLDAPKVL